MKNKSKQKIITMCECAVMVAMSVALSLFKIVEMPQGGSITVEMIPLLYFAYRRGWTRGIAAGALSAIMQMIIGGFYPPANTFRAVAACMLLDYLLAFGVLGTAPLFAKLFGRLKLLGWTVGAAAACVLRFLCSWLSGIAVWGSFAPEGQPVWLYSLVYNGSYMLPNTIIAAVAVCLICTFLSPETLRPYKRKEK